MHEAERAARIIREQAGLDDDAGPVAIAVALMGPHAIAFCSRLPQKAEYHADTDRIWLRRELAATAAAYLVGHELGERYLRGRRMESSVREAFCDAVAVRLLAPTSLVREAIGAHGGDHVAVARALATTQTIAVVRIAEVTNAPIVAVLPGRIIVRGEEFAWPDERGVRMLARGPLPDGVERLEITDAARRFALRAA